MLLYTLNLIIMIFSLSLLNIVYGFETTKYGRRGTAKMMTDFPVSNNHHHHKKGIHRHNKTSSLIKRDRVTWYTGRDLKNAACYDRNGLAPFHAKAEHLVGAMAMNDFEECYRCMRIINNNHPKMQVTVKIVDKCEACTVGNAIDLTPGAFGKLTPKGDLDIGVLDISFHPIRCPRNSLLIPKLPRL